MTDVLVEFDAVLTATNGSRWVPRACGRVAEDGLWEGWLEFLPTAEGADPVRSGRETEQPNRDDLTYWAQGLSRTYLEGALERAIGARPGPFTRHVEGRPHFEKPAPHAVPDDTALSGDSGLGRHPVLNPFEVYQEGQDILVQQLSALATGRLRDIAVAYGFGDPATVDGAAREQLTSIIVAGVRRPLADEDHREPDVNP
jgi:hypothetical protein